MKNYSFVALLLLLASFSFSQSVVIGTGVNAGGVNSQVGTSYTVAATDQGKLVTFNNGSAVTVSLPQATGQFGAGWYVETCDYGAGTVTITPQSGTINGGATLTEAQNVCDWIFSDGTNYSASVHAAAGGGGVNAGTANQVAYYATNGSVVSGNPNFTADSAGNVSATQYTSTGNLPDGYTAIVDPTVSTVAGLPGGPSVNQLAIVTDGANGSDCTAGLGASKNLCQWSGSTWIFKKAASGILWLSSTTAGRFKWFDGTAVQLVDGVGTTDTVSNKTLDNSNSLSGFITDTEITTPGAPSAGKNKVYVKANNGICTLDSGATERCIGAGAETTLTAYINPLAQRLGSTWALGASGSIRVFGILLFKPVTFSNIVFRVATSDASGTNHYDVGIYTIGGTLQAHIGAQTGGGGAFGSTGDKDLAVAGGGPITLQPGKYYFALTGDAIVAALEAGGSNFIQFADNKALATSSSGGVLPGTVTGQPADSWVSGGYVYFALH